jgi:hypothetical protein
LAEIDNGHLEVVSTTPPSRFGAMIVPAELACMKFMLGSLITCNQEPEMDLSIGDNNNSPINSSTSFAATVAKRRSRHRSSLATAVSASQ